MATMTERVAGSVVISVLAAVPLAIGMSMIGIEPNSGSWWAIFGVYVYGSFVGDMRGILRGPKD